MPPGAGEVARVLRPGGFLVLAAHARGATPAGWSRQARCAGAWRRRGFEPIWSEEAGDGSFSVARLRGGGPAGRRPSRLQREWRSPGRR